MVEHPIVFDEHSVRAALDGRKTQTRLVMRKPWPSGSRPLDVDVDPPAAVWYEDGGHWSKRSPCWNGDLLWVRETWRRCAGPLASQNGIEHHADGSMIPFDTTNRARALGLRKAGDAWRSPLHMPRWASRLTLEVLDVRVERLQAITEEDARAEGVVCDGAGRTPSVLRLAFADLWDRINGKRPGCAWADNPFVWRVEFKL